MIKPRKLSLLEKAIIAGAGILGLASAVDAQEVKLVENPVDTVPYSQVSNDSVQGLNLDKNDPEISLGVTVGTNYTAHGFVISEVDPLKRGDVVQPFVDVAFTNGLSFNAWLDFDIDDHSEGVYAWHEIDLIGKYTREVDDNTSVSVGGGAWTFPSGTFGSVDYVSIVGVSHTANVPLLEDVDLGVEWYHLFNDNDVKAGESIIGNISKTFPLGKIGDFDVSGTLDSDLVHLSDFYDFSGFSAMIPGASFSLEKDDSSLNFFIDYQIGYNGMPNDFASYGLELVVKH